MASTVIRAREMHCESCERAIRIGLSRLAGVRTVIPSAERNDVRVHDDEATLGEDQLRDVLREVGYEPLD